MSFLAPAGAREGGLQCQAQAHENACARPLQEIPVARDDSPPPAPVDSRPQERSEEEDRFGIQGVNAMLKELHKARLARRQRQAPKGSREGHGCRKDTEAVGEEATEDDGTKQAEVPHEPKVFESRPVSMPSPFVQQSLPRPLHSAREQKKEHERGQEPPRPAAERRETREQQGGQSAPQGSGETRGGEGGRRRRRQWAADVALPQRSASRCCLNCVGSHAS